MAKEHAQAFSVANRYFVFADGMLPGFKDHLAENVVLKWFGQVVKGKENVAAFMLSNKMETIHKFSDIMPISDISYKRKQSYWKAKRSLDQNCETYMNYLPEAPARSSHETEMSMTRENVKDCDQENNADDGAAIHKAACNKFIFNKLNKSNKRRILEDRHDVNVNIVNQNEFSVNTIAEMDDRSYDLNKTDLYKLFEPEITSQLIIGKIQNINRIKLKEEVAPTVRAINRDCGQGDGPVTAEANMTKYLEANGEIKFRRTAVQGDSVSLYHWSKLGKKKFCTRQCRLQIAFSLIDNYSPTAAKKCESAQENTCSTRVSNHPAKICHKANKIQKSKLPSLEEAVRASNTLIQDVNHFGGYLQPINFLEDRENFLKAFKAKVKDSDLHFCADYVNDKLVLNFPNSKPFKAIYQIHKIVYTSINANACNTKETKTAQVQNETVV